VLGIKGLEKYFFSLKRRPSCQTVLNTFATSRKTPAQYFLVSRASDSVCNPVKLMSCGMVSTKAELEV